jgi:cysteine desulfurase
MAEIYLDNTAATPLDPRVLEEMMPFLESSFGNPSSLHSVGIAPRAAVVKARENVAGLIGADPGEIVFTSGATEANNLAVKGIALAAKAGRGTIVVSRIEHLSVFNAARRLERLGFSIGAIPVDGEGLVDPADVDRAITDDTILVSVNVANPEVGTLEPVKEIAQVTKARGVPLHCDAAAAAGWVPIDVRDIGADLLTISAQSFYGPKGAGALFVRRGLRLIPLIDGGPQEGGLRAGTENVPGVVGMGKAAELAVAELERTSRRLAPLRDKLIEDLTKSVEGVVLTGHRTSRLPGHASFCVRGIEGEALLADLDRKGIAAASGSACASVALKISHVLEAMGLDTVLARGSVVFTLGRDAQADRVGKVTDVVKSSIKRLRELSPV